MVVVWVCLEAVGPGQLVLLVPLRCSWEEEEGEGSELVEAVAACSGVHRDRQCLPLQLGER